MRRGKMRSDILYQQRSYPSSARDNCIILKVYSSLCMWEKSARGDERGQRARPTVDGDGHALVQNVTVLALKGGDLAQLVELQVLGGGLGGVDLDDVELEVVGLRNGANRRAPGVVLRKDF